MDAAQTSATEYSGVTGTPSPQFAVLNHFFPGFSVLTSAASTYLGTDVNVFIPFLLARFSLTVAWSYSRESLWNLIHEYLMSSACIRTDDEIYDIVMLWLARQNFSQNARHFLANTVINSRRRFVYSQNDSNDEENEDDYSPDDELRSDAAAGTWSQKGTVHYTPASGFHWFWYRGYPLMLERRQNRPEVNFQTLTEREELSLSCFGRNPWILKELLSDARQLYMERDECKTLIYRANLSETYWQRCLSRPNRSLSTVILNERVKQKLIDDVTDYLNPITRRWYANRGVPYRRGYLLHGPPGTGKSSLTAALAGYFRMKIYIVSLESASASEENIATLFNELPTQCIVLLEDIDSAGLTHTRDELSTTNPTVDTSPSLPGPGHLQGRLGAEPPASGRLALSGLLNILDGVASQEGRILVMTTNHIDKLDKALIRPGRVDMSVPFGLADSTMIASIFRAIYAPYENESTLFSRVELDGKARTGNIYGEEVKETDPASIIERVEVLAKCFARKLPEFEFSPAEVQGLLLRHKHRPREAIKAVEDWVMHMRHYRKETREREAEKRRRIKNEMQRVNERQDAKQESSSEDTD